MRSLTLHFGKWILIGTALTFLATQSDRLILGKLVSIETLGVYGIAFALSDLPRQIIMMFCTRVGYPVYCQVCATSANRVPRRIT